VVDRIRDLAWPAIYGNADEMLWNSAAVAEYFAVPALQHWRAVVDRSIEATLPALGGERLAWLQHLPPLRSEHGVTIVHASPGDCWRAPGKDAPDAVLKNTYAALGDRIAVYGHIHAPFVRRVGSFIVANCGSVSLPYDGDNRAAYLLIDGEQVMVQRVEYDIEREIALLQQAGVPDAAWVGAMLRAGRPLPFA
jgi:hypothetical protein